MPHPATVRRQAREQRRRFARVLAELQRDRAPIRTESHARRRAFGFAYAAGFASAVLMLALVMLAR